VEVGTVRDVSCHVRLRLGLGRVQGFGGET
jgi:hypothetical protein